MVQNIQPFSPPPFQAGGFNLPPGSPQAAAGFNNPANNAFATMGQNPTLAGTNPMTQFNAAAYNPFANDPRTAMLYQSATGQADPMLAAAQLGLKPQIISTGLGGMPMAMGAGMSSMALNIAIEAAKIGLQNNDTKGFMSIMGNLAKDPTASLDPRFQQLVPAYQQLMGAVGAQSAAITTGANAAQVQQMGQIQVMMQQLMEQNKKLVALLAESGIPADKLNAIMNPSAPPTTSTPSNTTSTTQQQTQALFKNQMKSATTT